MATITLDQKIDELTKRKATLVQQINYIATNIPISQAYCRKMVAEGNYTEANKVSQQIDNLSVEQKGLEAELKTINETLPLLIEQKQIQLTAQQAVVNQVNATSSNQMNADQQLQLALAKLESERTAMGQKSMNDTQTQQAGTAATKTRNYIIGAVVAVVIVVVIVVMARKK